MSPVQRTLHRTLTPALLATYPVCPPQRGNRGCRPREGFRVGLLPSEVVCPLEGVPSLLVSEVPRPGATCPLAGDLPRLTSLCGSLPCLPSSVRGTGADPSEGLEKVSPTKGVMPPGRSPYSPCEMKSPDLERRAPWPKTQHPVASVRQGWGKVPPTRGVMPPWRESLASW